MAKREEVQEPRAAATILGVNKHRDRVGAIIMMAVGFLVFIISLGVGTKSAFQETSAAAIWTGWNVFWGMVGLLSPVSTTYKVYYHYED